MIKALFRTQLFIAFAFIVLLSHGVQAQKWAINIAYANTEPAVEGDIKNFHGVDLSFERKILKRLNSGVNFSTFMPSSREWQGFNASSTTTQRIVAYSAYLNFDVLQTHYLDLYLQTGYRNVRHTTHGYLNQFIDFPTDGPSRLRKDIDDISNHHGYIVGIGLNLNSDIPLFIEYSSITAFQSYFDLKIGMKISM